MFIVISEVSGQSQSLWTTKPKDYYHPNQLSTRCVVESFSSWLTVPPFGVVVHTRWLNLTNICNGRKYLKLFKIFQAQMEKGNVNAAIRIVTNHMGGGIHPLRMAKP